MNTIAHALVIAVAYIADRDPNSTADDDVRKLESISAILADISEAERKALVAAAVDQGLPDWPEQLGLNSL